MHLDIHPQALLPYDWDTARTDLHAQLETALTAYWACQEGEAGLQQGQASAWDLKGLAQAQTVHMVNARKVGSRGVHTWRHRWLELQGIKQLS